MPKFEDFRKKCQQDIQEARAKAEAERVKAEAAAAERKAARDAEEAAEKALFDKLGPEEYTKVKMAERKTDPLDLPLSRPIAGDDITAADSAKIKPKAGATNLTELQEIALGVKDDEPERSVTPRKRG
jgi:membrane protein involved in colicin uptake